MMGRVSEGRVHPDLDALGCALAQVSVARAPAPAPAVVHEAPAEELQEECHRFNIDLFWKMGLAHPRMFRQVSQVIDNNMSHEERAEARALRFQKMRARAEKAIAEHAGQRHLALKDQGDLTMYSDAKMRIREGLREEPRVCQLLLKWWHAAVIYDDRDHDANLDKEEYAIFHDRLRRLIEPVDGRVPSAEDVLAIKVEMEADFNEDAGANGKLTKHDFMNSVFELCDNWTDTTDVEEYVEFLQIGYHRVFGELEYADRLRFPDEWLPWLNWPKLVTPMRESRAYDLCIKAYLAEKKAAGEITLAEAVLCEVRALKSRDADVKKMMASFVHSLEKAQKDTDHDDILWLFARHVGCYTLSTKMRSVPPEASICVVRLLDDVHDIAAHTKGALPMKVMTYEEAHIVSGQVAGYAAYVGLTPMLQLLYKNGFAKLGLKARGPNTANLKEAAADLLKMLAYPLEDLEAPATVPCLSHQGSHRPASSSRHLLTASASTSSNHHDARHQGERRLGHHDNTLLHQGDDAHEHHQNHQIPANHSCHQHHHHHHHHHHAHQNHGHRPVKANGSIIAHLVTMTEIRFVLTALWCASNADRCREMDLAIGEKIARFADEGDATVARLIRARSRPRNALLKDILDAEDLAETNGEDGDDDDHLAQERHRNQPEARAALKRAGKAFPSSSSPLTAHRCRDPARAPGKFALKADALAHASPTRPKKAPPHDKRTVKF